MTRILKNYGESLIGNFRLRFPCWRKFLAYSLSVIEVATTPEMEEDAEKLIRDVKDRPILRAALNAKADVLLTGDKDFLESGVTDPKIMTAAEFLENVVMEFLK